MGYIGKSSLNAFYNGVYPDRDRRIDLGIGNNTLKKLQMIAKIKERVGEIYESTRAEGSKREKYPPSQKKKAGVSAGLDDDSGCEARQCAIALTISSVTFLASPKSIIVLGMKNSSFSTPA